MGEPLLGGWGASDGLDGDSGQFCCGNGETYNIPIELAENADSAALFVGVEFPQEGLLGFGRVETEPEKTLVEHRFELISGNVLLPRCA